MILANARQGIYIDDKISNSLPEIDAVIFDCDGVLIDVTKSYDLTINNTALYILKDVAKISDSIPIDSEIIDGFKSTGGFNDEVDLAYASILAIVAAKRLKRDQRSFIYDVIANADSTGISSVEKHIQKFVDVKDIMKILDYPGPHAENPLYRVFDQMFYGPQMYKKLFNCNSEFSESGLIENDLIIVSKDLLDVLYGRFLHIGMVTGRGIESVRYSLKELLGKFDLENSFFLEDESRELAKPNPEPLLRAIRGMNSRCCLYVGDSMEDLIMAKRATKLGCRTIFCGITGTNRNSGRKLELFERNGAQLVLESIKLLPKALNLE